MNENSNSASSLSPPAVLHEQARRTSSRSSFLTWLGRVFPSGLVLSALGGIAYFGHQTGWTLPKFSVLVGQAQQEKDDWCNEHSIPESQCVECNSTLLAKGKEFGWCKKHGIPECPFEHPEVAQLKERPRISEADLSRAERALVSAERPENNSKCKLHLRRIQFASKEAVEKAGIEVAPVWEAPIAEAISANGEITYDQTRVARLSTRAAGSIWWVAKKVGDAVKEGEVLALVDAGEVGRAKGELLQAARWFFAGRLAPVVDRVLPLDQAAEAQRALESREPFGKVVLTPNERA